MKKFISLFVLTLSTLCAQATPLEQSYILNSDFGDNNPLYNWPVIVSGTNVTDGTIGFVAFDSATAATINGKFTKPTGTTSQVVLGDGTLGTLPAVSLSSATLQTGFTANTVYTNDTGGTVELQGFASYTFALISGSAYLTTQVASNSAAAFTTTTSIGSATLLTGLTPGRSDSFQLKIPRNWVGKVVTTVSGVGNSIAVNGTVLKIVTP